MLLDAIVEQVIRAISGGIDTADSRFDGSYIEDKIHEYRILQLIASYNGTRYQAKNRFIHYSYYQNFDISRIERVQDVNVNYVKFPCPSPANISDKVDGLTFVGNRSKNYSWSKIQSPEQVSQLVKLGLMDTNDIGYFYDGQFLRLYGNLDLENVHVEGVFQNPLDVPDFNPETDNYPMPDDAIPMMIEMMKRMEFNQMVQTVPDYIADGADTVTNATLRNNKR